MAEGFWVGVGVSCGDDQVAFERWAVFDHLLAKLRIGI